jgi:DNA-binding NtrC family response regulator
MLVSNMVQTVLIIEDDMMQAELLARLVKKNDLHVLTATTGAAALNLLETPAARQVRVIILDMMMPGMNGLETMTHLRQRHADIPVIFLTAVQDVHLAVDAMKLGAFDFMTKPYDAERMIITIRNAFRLGSAQAEAKQLKWAGNSVLTFSDLIGHNGGLADVIAAGKRVARTDVPVLIMGETGVGKEVFARALHGESTRHDKPFIAVNCGAIPEQLIESILFGHEKGSFTGATERTPGKFREAEGGTIFLDEIGEMPLSAQIRLLRVLQQREIEPVGAAQTVPINVRIISATHRDLTMDVRHGRFREDVLFRLNVFPLTLPPLRQRTRDIPSLVHHFLERFAELDHLPQRTISQAALKHIAELRWSGNVRELENTIRRTLVMSDKKIITPGDLSLSTELNPAEIIIDPELATAQKSAMFINLLDDLGATRTMEQLETAIFDRILKHHKGNMTAAAKSLGIAKSTLYRKIGQT